MIRTLLTTTAISVLLTAGVIAQDAAPATPAPAATTQAPAAGTTAVTPAPEESGAMETTDTDEPWDMSKGYVAVDSDNLASELIDQSIYSSTGDDAEDIGKVTDLIFSEDGMITGVVVGVGGFLGIGEKSVAVPFNLLEFTLAADNTERWVVPTTKDALTSAPDFVWQKDEPADANDNNANGNNANGGAMAPADTTGGAMAPADTTTPAPAVQ
jgi:sporulation protein YlmC with PRC-barrel domain